MRKMQVIYFFYKAEWIKLSSSLPARLVNILKKLSDDDFDKLTRRK